MGSLLTVAGAARTRELMQSAVSWWYAEFINLLPQRIAAVLSARGRPRVVLARCDGGIRLRLSDPRSGGDTAEISSAEPVVAIGALLARRGLDRREVELGLELPKASVFCRDVVLPAEARGAIDTILPQDLLRRTPFKAEDIYSDHAASTAPDGRIAVRQWVTRRQHVQRAADELGLSVEEITFVMFGNAEAAQTIRLARETNALQPHRIAIAALCCSAVLLAGGLAGLTYVRQQAALDRLDAEIVVARRNAERVRATVEQLRERRMTLTRLRLQRSETPGLIDIWDETTHLLPRHSWLTELRLAEGDNGRSATVTMTGFSAAAPGLVNILDASKLFADAALTSPVAMDPVEGRERFSLQAKVRLPDALKEAGQ
ncbi:PilN domain-containing protein [Bradyrhizobium sp. SZCCHNS3004]|uniref:PilN domain-containing protein n=1 Tax=Bradyrhizobium sp. SZCCHNS3004 TaxID=3057312 RepID=UPI002916818F|nr:PilN domain-containing protein [Bradyrhizobium sp. SZCCHNS3004]